MRVEISKFKLAFAVLSITTIIGGIAFYYTFQEYRRYYEDFRGADGELPNPYYAWNGGLYVTVTTECLLFLWIPFIVYSVRQKVYPYLKPRLSYQELKRFYGSLSRSTYDILYGSVLRYFKKVNRKARSKIADWSMTGETLQHVESLIKVFKWVVLPGSILYVFADFYLFRENALDSMFLGILIFIYSNFLPDLPSIFRQKVYHDVRDSIHEDLPWYKKYALLLFAPLFIGLFFLGIPLSWKTTENFHNFKSLTIYLVFLSTLSLFAFGDYPISIGDVTKIVSFPLYAMIGYLTHLKVDLCL